MRTIPCATLPFLFLCVALPVQAQLTSPQIGWQAELSKLAHNVSGTVTILDENTVQVDDFTYDGGGIDVFFYLGKENTRDSFKTGLKIGSNLLTHVYNGSEPPFMIDLPAGNTLEGWNAISVWCVTASANFGSGTFGPTIAPLEGDFNNDGWVDSADYVAWRNGLGGDYDENDYADWRANFGAVSPAAAQNPGAFSMASVPEPALFPLLMTLAALGLLGGRRFIA
jgi:hypothetical protein